MPKRKGSAGSGKRSTRTPVPSPSSSGLDLDNGFLSPISSLRDITGSNLKNTIIHSRYLQIIIVLTFVGLILRLYHLDYNSLWLDEAATYLFSLHPFSEYWNLISQGGEVHPPLFYWLEYFMLLFGNNEFTLRFIPAIVGVASIPLTYILGKEILDRNVGIIAAALLTFSSFHIMYSQEARMYSLLLLFIVIAFTLYVRAMRNNSFLLWALFGLISALALWTHFIAIVFIGVLFVYAVAMNLKRIRENIKSIRPIIISLIIFLLISSPLLFIGFQLFLIRTASAPTWGVQGVEVITSTLSQFSGYNSVLLIIFLFLFIAGLVQIFWEKRWISILVVIIFLASFITGYVLSYLMPISPRYMIYLLPLFLAGIASAYKPLFTILKTQKVIYIFLIAMIALNIPSLVDYYSEYSKDDWRGVSLRVSGSLHSGDVIVLVPAYNNGPFDYYYKNATHGTLEFGASTAGELEGIYSMNEQRRILYVVTNDISAADPTGGSITWLREHATSVEVYRGIYLLT